MIPPVAGGSARPDRQLHVLHAGPGGPGDHGALRRLHHGHRGGQGQHRRRRRAGVFLGQADRRGIPARSITTTPRAASEALEKAGKPPIDIHTFGTYADVLQGVAGRAGGWRLHRHGGGVLLSQEGPRLLPHRAHRLRPRIAEALAFKEPALADAVAAVLNDMKADGSLEKIFGPFGALPAARPLQRSPPGRCRRRAVRRRPSEAPRMWDWERLLPLPPQSLPAEGRGHLAGPVGCGDGAGPGLWVGRGAAPHVVQPPAQRAGGVLRLDHARHAGAGATHSSSTPACRSSASSSACSPRR